MEKRGWLSCLLVLFFVLSPEFVWAQEFDCQVDVDYRQLSGSEYTFLADLEEQVEDYMNERSWTDDRFMRHERIDCRMQIVIEEAPSLTDFRARLIIATRRPIYGTTQYSTVMQINDGPWQFSYTQGSSLTQTPERYDPLTSVLDFYAYVMLGYDYDTFSELGGTPHFERARRIAQMARSNQAPGWEASGNDQGRGALISQLLDPRFRPLRSAFFNYHFGGLDHFVQDAASARATILEVLQDLQEMDRNVSRRHILDLFFATKSTELASIFQGSNQRTEAYTLLTSMDSSSEYDRLTQ